jgi:hypothetical protein
MAQLRVTEVKIQEACHRGPDLVMVAALVSSEVHGVWLMRLYWQPTYGITNTAKRPIWEGRKQHLRWSRISSGDDVLLVLLFRKQRISLIEYIIN